MSAPQWQTIETAPKDGTEFLAFRPIKCVVDSHIIAVCLWLDSKNVDYCGEFPHVTWDHSAFDGATHWMPLPAPPAAPKFRSDE